MRKILLAVVASLLCAAAAPPPSPVVVELFTSQGCSSCPPANAAVAAVADRPDVIALSFAVTYWDNLGWKDTFGRPEYTERQGAYARALGHDGPFTPEVVAGGRTDSVGNSPAKVAALIGQARAPAATRVALSPAEVAIGAGVAPRGGADVWLVRYDPRTVAVPIRAGENNGKTLPHRNVVRELTRLGGWTGSATAFRLAPSPPGLRSVVLVQRPRGGAILAAARL